MDKESIFPDDYYQYDPSDMKKALEEFPRQIKEAYKLGKNINIEGELNRIIVTGMGGSAIAGDILKAFLKKENINVEVNRDYDLPLQADNKTLVFVSSYSGNTEETISAYRAAIRKNCHVITITTGGKLEELSEMNRTKMIKIPSGMEPKQAIAYSFFPMIKVLENLRIIENKKREVERLIKALNKEIYKETGINLSEKLVGKIPLIYSSHILAPVAYRWKTQLNENSKVMASNNVFSELNHNEIAGIENLQATFHCIIIKTDIDHRRIMKRMGITKTILRKRDIDVTEIGIKGDALLTKLFSAIHIGDWTSYFLALRYKTDPAPTKAIEEFKKELGPYVA